MIYDCSNDIEAKKMLEKAKWMAENKKLTELTQKRYKRTFKQNRYFYLLLGAFAMETGYTVTEVKKLLYQDWCIDIFGYEKKGYVFFRSSADLDTLEMTNVINRLKNRAAKAGIPLPDAEDIAYLNHIEKELSKYQNYQYT